ncbi:unnamed protein product [Amoebophrya sp. A25]|nr:unnamed protein product [Amoebophrya sp. A25]|eukprot:GSA25T00000132001.1
MVTSRAGELFSSDDFDVPLPRESSNDGRILEVTSKGSGRGRNVQSDDELAGATFFSVDEHEQETIEDEVGAVENDEVPEPEPDSEDFRNEDSSSSDSDPFALRIRLTTERRYLSEGSPYGRNLPPNAADRRGQARSLDNSYQREGSSGQPLYNSYSSRAGNVPHRSFSTFAGPARPPRGVVGRRNRRRSRSQIRARRNRGTPEAGTHVAGSSSSRETQDPTVGVSPRWFDETGEIDAQLGGAHLAEDSYSLRTTRGSYTTLVGTDEADATSGGRVETRIETTDLASDAAVLRAQARRVARLFSPPAQTQGWGHSRDSANALENRNLLSNNIQDCLLSDLPMQNPKSSAYFDRAEAARLARSRINVAEAKPLSLVRIAVPQRFLQSSTVAQPELVKFSPSGNQHNVSMSQAHDHEGRRGNDHQSRGGEAEGQRKNENTNQHDVENTTHDITAATSQKQGEGTQSQSSSSFVDATVAWSVAPSQLVQHPPRWSLLSLTLTAGMYALPKIVKYNTLLDAAAGEPSMAAKMNQDVNRAIAAASQANQDRAGAAPPPVLASASPSTSDTNPSATSSDRVQSGIVNGNRIVLTRVSGGDSSDTADSGGLWARLFGHRGAPEANTSEALEEQKNQLGYRLQMLMQQEAEIAGNAVLPIELDLPTDVFPVFHSSFVCPVSRTQSTEPWALGCGHVISKATLDRLSRSTRRAFKCPVCPTQQTVAQSKKLVFGPEFA